MQRYAHSTGFMDLAADATGAVVWSLSNPAATAGQPGRYLIVKRLHAEMTFSGVPAAARTAIGFGRATGTAAAGSGNAAGATIGRRFPLANDPLGLIRFGPTPITGLTPDSVGDLLTIGIPQQLTAELARDLITPNDGPVTDPFDLDNNWVLAPGTSLYAIVRVSASIAGLGLAIDVEWAERQFAQYQA